MTSERFEVGTPVDGPVFLLVLVRQLQRMVGLESPRGGIWDSSHGG